MSKHKAPTQVTVAPLEEKSDLEHWIAKYWIHATAVAALITAVILYSHYSRGEETAKRDQSWATLAERTETGSFPRVPTAPPEALAALATDLKGTAAGPWARLLEATTLIREERYDDARTAVDELKRDYPEHALVADAMDFGDGRPPRSLADNILDALDRQSQWQADHPELFANPAPAEDAPRVRLRTDRGDIVLALYADRAPKHVENFLKLCSEGYYDGVKFHSITPGSSVRAGDPNSREGDPETWGQGGPEQTVPYEDNGLFHFSGVVTSVQAPGTSESHGSQFAITVAPQHFLDGRSVVFGEVVEGMEVVAEISGGPLEDGSPDRPSDPATITSVEVL